MEESDDGPTLDESVDIVIQNLVADESTLLDILDNNSNEIFIPPHVTPVVHDDVTVDQEENMEENPEEEQEKPLGDDDDDDPNPELNINEENFNLQVCYSHFLILL